MMTLEEAIKHCKDIALSCTNKECALEHFQLLKWLQEYSNMLEKQGKQKSADKVGVWSEEDENIICFLINIIEGYKIRNGFSSVLEQGNKAIDWIKSLKDRVQPQSKQEWSEEDKTKINYLIALLQNCTMNNDSLRVMNEEIEDWLKSLHPSWKPSDEQITQLKRYCPDNRPLTSLYEQLKKLKEE